MQKEISKHEIYRGNQQEFRKIIKHLDKEYIQQLQDEGKLNEVAKAVQETITRSVGSIPRICSEACDIIENCPFHLYGKIPEGKQCPIESYILENVSIKLQKELLDDRDVTPSDLISLSSLLALYMLSHRISNKIAIDGLTTLGVIKTQQGFTETQVTNPMIKELLDIQSEMQKILKNLHLLRIERVKHKPEKKKVEKEQSIDITKLYTKLKDKGINPQILSEIIQEVTENVN